MASTFGSILDKPANQIERPKPLPIGTYLCVVRGQPRFDKSAKKQTPFVEFTLVPTQALDDVDEEMLAEVLRDPATGEQRALNTLSIPATFYYESQGWRLMKFLAHCGICEEEDETETRSPRAMIDETPNCSVLATIRHEAGQNPSEMYARIASTAKAE